MKCIVLHCIVGKRIYFRVRHRSRIQVAFTIGRLLTGYYCLKAALALLVNIIFVDISWHGTVERRLNIKKTNSKHIEL